VPSLCVILVVMSAAAAVSFLIVALAREWPRYH
jgi:hypothetical protein